MTVLTRLRCPCGSLLFRVVALPHPEALALRGDHDSMVSETIEERSGELLVATEDLWPLRECEIGGDEHAASFVAMGDGVEQQLAAGSVERDEADLVENQHVN